MESTRAETLLRLMKTTLAVIPSDNDELPLFGDDPFVDTELFVDELVCEFQKNNLFTPRFAESHPEIILHTNYLASNFTWPTSLVVAYAMEDHTPSEKKLVAETLLRTSHEDVTEHVLALGGEHMVPHLETYFRTFESIESHIKTKGGFQSVYYEERTIQYVMRDPYQPLGTIINLAARTGIPDAPERFRQNPFNVELATNVRIDTTDWYRNENPDTIRELLGLVRDAMTNIQEDIRQSPFYSIPSIFNALSVLVSCNPVWDPQMESEFGGIVWPLIWGCLMRMYRSRRIFQTKKEQMEARLYLHHRNPSWFLSKKMCEYYSSGTSPRFTKEHMDIPYERICSHIMELLPGMSYSDYFAMGFCDKKTLCVADIKWYVQYDTRCYYLKSIASNTELRGEAALRIVRFLMRKWVVPRRHHLEMERIRLILRKASTNVAGCDDITRTIVSFLNV